MAIEVGDAVLRFIGDSQQLNTKFDEVGPNAEKAFAPAAEAAEDAGERMGASMREARGEVRLLGEEVGIRLPRHVGNFLAELPGVGSAMSAAFSATAVLFLIQALVEGTNKLTDWISNTYIFTDAMKAINSSVAESNKLFALQKSAIDSAKEALEDYGLDKIELARKNIDGLRDTMNKENEAAAAAKNTMFGLNAVLGEAAEKNADYQKAATENIRATNAATEADLKRQLAIKQLADMEHEASMRELDNQKKIALSYAENDQERYELDQAYEQKKLALLNTYGVKDKEAIEQLNREIETQQIQHADKIAAAFAKMLQMVGDAQSHAAEAVKDSVVANAIALTPLQEALKKAEDAAHAMNITMGVDLVYALEKAKTAEQAFAMSGIVDATAMVALQKATKDAQTALDSYGVDEGKFSIKTHGLFKQLEEDSKTGATAMNQWKQVGATALSDVAQSAQSALSSLILAQGSFGKALEQATEHILASIASQAIVSGIFDLAKAYEASAGQNYPAAAQYTAAAETMFIVGAIAGGAAAGLARAGGGSGSSNTTQSANTNSNTGQSNRSVPAMADGGLITQPTLVLAGESGREAIIPLDNPSAQQQMRGAGVGGGTVNHFHINGMISSDNLSKVMKNMSKLVSNGKATLKSSDSLRLTKRSA